MDIFELGKYNKVRKINSFMMTAVKLNWIQGFDKMIKEKSMN